MRWKPMRSTAPAMWGQPAGLSSLAELDKS